MEQPQVVRLRVLVVAPSPRVASKITLARSSHFKDHWRPTAPAAKVLQLERNCLAVSQGCGRPKSQLLERVSFDRSVAEK
jgi:hypothetical protein